MGATEVMVEDVEFVGEKNYIQMLLKGVKIHKHLLEDTEQEYYSHWIVYSDIGGSKRHCTRVQIAKDQDGPIENRKMSYRFQHMDYGWECGTPIRFGPWGNPPRELYEILRLEDMETPAAKKTFEALRGLYEESEGIEDKRKQRQYEMEL